MTSKRQVLNVKVGESLHDAGARAGAAMRAAETDMRTTLAIDDDILAAAKQMAERQRLSLGEVISALARQSLHKGPRGSDTRNGIPLLPRRSGVPAVTLKLVNQLRDEPV